jgi:hypothetical protein
MLLSLLVGFFSVLRGSRCDGKSRRPRSRAPAVAACERSRNTAARFYLLAILGKPLRTGGV